MVSRVDVNGAFFSEGGDTNHDGYASEEEIKAWYEKTNREWGGIENYEKIKNEDYKGIAEEINKKYSLTQNAYNWGVDSNNDGVITEQEVKDFISKNKNDRGYHGVDAQSAAKKSNSIKGDSKDNNITFIPLPGTDLTYYSNYDNKGPMIYDPKTRQFSPATPETIKKANIEILQLTEEPPNSGVYKKKGDSENSYFFNTDGSVIRSPKEGSGQPISIYKNGQWKSESSEKISKEDKEKANILALGLKKNADGTYSKDGHPNYIYKINDDGSVLKTTKEGTSPPDTQVYRDGKWIGTAELKPQEKAEANILALGLKKNADGTYSKDGHPNYIYKINDDGSVLKFKKGNDSNMPPVAVYRDGVWLPWTS